MNTLQQCPPPVHSARRGIPATVEIRGARYRVAPIDPGEFGVSAARVTKVVGGQCYDVIRRRDGLIECDCPDFVCRREGTGTRCKHGASLLALGYLPAPISGGSPDGPPPAIIAPLDPSRARDGRVAGEYRPSLEDRSRPTAEAEAEWCGFELGLAGLAVVGPAHYSTEELAAFARGHAEGFRAFEAQEMDRWDDHAGPEAVWSHSEMVEAGGVTAARALCAH